MMCKYWNTRCLCQNCKRNAAYEHCQSGYCIECFECEEAGKSVHDVHICTGYEKATEYEANPKPITNADRIRSMGDEELAEFLNGTDGDFLPTGEALTVSAGKNRWLDWLRQEVADGEQS